MAEIRSQRQKFFYAEYSAGLYDSTIDLVVPNYDRLHEVMIWSLDNILDKESPQAVLDVGSGTGIDSIAVLKRFPNVLVVSLDLCEPIQHRHAEKLAKLPDSLRERNVLVAGDVLADFSEGEGLRDYLPPELGKIGFSAIITALTVHHFTHDEKRSFYSRMARILTSGGALINGDLFSYADPVITHLAQEYDLSWIRNSFANPPFGSREAKSLSVAERKRMSDLWIEHYLRDNNLEPLEDGSAMGQIKMLKEAGITEVSVPYRFMLSGVLLGRSGSVRS